MKAAAHLIPLHATQDRFWQAVLLAFFLHIGAWMVWHILPHVDTVVVPVRALNIRLGENEGLETPLAQQAATTPVAGASAPGPATTAAQATKPVAETRAAKASGNPAPAVEPPQDDGLARRYVRKVAPPQGSVHGNSTESEAETLARYEQLISSWVQRYKIYPSAARARGLQGEGVVRIRINRAGTILYHAIERSTGQSELDKAMLAMVRQASPVPPVPQRYPASTLVEFLIPVRFALENR